jgi:hypothetical protein
LHKFTIVQNQKFTKVFALCQGSRRQHRNSYWARSFNPSKEKEELIWGLGLGFFTGGGFACECYLFDAAWLVLVALFSFV